MHKKINNLSLVLVTLFTLSAFAEEEIAAPAESGTPIQETDTGAIDLNAPATPHHMKKHHKHGEGHTCNGDCEKHHAKMKSRHEKRQKHREKRKERRQKMMDQVEEMKDTTPRSDK